MYKMEEISTNHDKSFEIFQSEKDARKNIKESTECPLDYEHQQIKYCSHYGCPKRRRERERQIKRRQNKILSKY